MAKKLITICTDPDIGPILGPYITHFAAPELAKKGKLSEEVNDQLTEIGLRNTERWIPEESVVFDRRDLPIFKYDEKQEEDRNISLAIKRMRKILPTPETAAHGVYFDENDEDNFRKGILVLHDEPILHGRLINGKHVRFVSDIAIKILDALQIKYNQNIPDR